MPILRSGMPCGQLKLISNASTPTASQRSMISSQASLWSHRGCGAEAAGQGQGRSAGVGRLPNSCPTAANESNHPASMKCSGLGRFQEACSPTQPAPPPLWQLCVYRPTHTLNTPPPAPVHRQPASRVPPPSLVVLLHDAGNQDAVRVLLLETLQLIKHRLEGAVCTGGGAHRGRAPEGVVGVAATRGACSVLRAASRQVWHRHCVGAADEQSQVCGAVSTQKVTLHSAVLCLCPLPEMSSIFSQPNTDPALSCSLA